MVVRDPAMQAVIALADQVAPLRRLDPDHRRERLGQGSHRPLRPRRSRAAPSRPFISVNCAAIPENLLESELFGHEKGAFTGAVARRIGKFEEANGGTLLLDEISEMDGRLQAKLLRALQEREIDRVGGAKPVKVDIRILATSNRDLAQAVKDGHVPRGPALPPQRREPAPAAAARAARRRRWPWPSTSSRSTPPPTARRNGRSRPRPSAGWPVHRWPGNVRELENAMHRAVLLSTGPEIEEVRHPPAGRPAADRRRSAAPHRPGRLLRRRGRQPRLRRPDRGGDGAAADHRDAGATASATAPTRPTSWASRSAPCATSSRNTPRPASRCPRRRGGRERGLIP